MRIVVVVAALAGLAALYPWIQPVLGSVVWLLLFFGGAISDVSGPSWLDGLLYAPTIMIYLGAAALGVLWARAAPRR